MCLQHSDGHERPHTWWKATRVPTEVSQMNKNPKWLFPTAFVKKNGFFYCECVGQIVCHRCFLLEGCQYFQSWLRSSISAFHGPHYAVWGRIQLEKLGESAATCCSPSLTAEMEKADSGGRGTCAAAVAAMMTSRVTAVRLREHCQLSVCRADPPSPVFHHCRLLLCPPPPFPHASLLQFFPSPFLTLTFRLAFRFILCVNCLSLFFSFFIIALLRKEEEEEKKEA